MSSHASSSSSHVQEIFGILMKEPDSNSQIVQNAVRELENMERGVVESEISNIIRSTATFKAKKVPIPIPIPVPILNLQLVPLIRFGRRESEVWSSTAYLLSLIRNLALKPLLEASLDSDEMVSYYSTTLLRVFGEQKAVPFLIQALESPYVNVRRNAVRALAELRDIRAVFPLIKTAKDWTNVSVLIDKAGFSFKKADQALAEMGIDKSRGGDDSCFIRDDALRALMQLGCSVKEILPHFSNFPPKTCSDVGKILMQIDVFDKMTLPAFGEFLTSIGFNQKILESAVKSPTKGVIKLENANINYIVKDTSFDVAELSFVMECIGKKIHSLTLKREEDNNVLGKIKDLQWVTKNEKLASKLNNQQELMKLWTGIEYGNLVGSVVGVGRKSIWVEGNKVLETKDDSVIIFHRFHRLPAKEYFEAMEKVAYYIREVG